MCRRPLFTPTYTKHNSLCFSFSFSHALYIKIFLFFLQSKSQVSNLIFELINFSVGEKNVNGVEPKGSPNPIPISLKPLIRSILSLLQSFREFLASGSTKFRLKRCPTSIQNKVTSTAVHSPEVTTAANAFPTPTKGPATPSSTPPQVVRTTSAASVSCATVVLMQKTSSYRSLGESLRFRIARFWSEDPKLKSKCIRVKQREIVEFVLK